MHSQLYTTIRNIDLALEIGNLRIELRGIRSFTPINNNLGFNVFGFILQFWSNISNFLSYEWRISLRKGVPRIPNHSMSINLNHSTLENLDKSTEEPKRCRSAIVS